MTAPDLLDLGVRVSRRDVGLDELDALPWVAVHGPYQAHGHSFRVRCTDPDLARHLAVLMSSFATETAGDDVVTYSLFEYDTEDGSAWTLYADTTRITYNFAPPKVVAILLWFLNRRVIASVDDGIALHAGCVASEGRGVVLAAPMESGKTTLTAGLLRRGLDYLTDEAVVIDQAASTLHGYPKPLSIDDGAWPLFPDLEPSGPAAAYVEDQWHVPAGRIRPDNVVATARPTLLLAPSYAPGGATRVVRVSPSRMLELLAESTFRFHEQGARNLRGLARLVATCTYYRLEVADLEDACDLVLNLLEAP